MITVLGYEIQEKIRHHRNIDTYQGLRLKDKQKVFLKIPNNQDSTSENLAILQHEYNLLQKLKKPTIIKAYDFLQNTPGPVLVLENLEGEILSDYLAENQLEIDDFFNLALQLIDILNELHENNIIHKELRPSNLIVDIAKSTLKLLDLSASAKVKEERFDAANLKRMGEDFAYISPEQTGKVNRVIDYRTDFYSLGITLYHMITGQLPFQATDKQELIYAHIAKKPPSVMEARRNIPIMLAAIIEKLLEKMPEDRYSSCAGIKADLHECYKQWIIKKTVTDYSLAANDVHDRLSISRNLYGRESQVHQLLEAFSRVSKGTKEIVYVSGYSGIGKTSLVKEVYKPIVEHRGYYIHGKFDQLQRGMPYSAIVAAFRSLVKQVLSESQERVEELRKYLNISLGSIGQVIIDVIPEVEALIGKQPLVPVINPNEAQIRFNLAFQNFVRVFAQANHPLVIFLDDLQWADNSSLSFIENLLLDKETDYLLIIGAYRDNEINEHHPLQMSINTLQKNWVECTTLHLEPLQFSDIQQLLQDALSATPEKLQGLAECVRDKTQGNPFFINEFLKQIYQDKFLSFDYELGIWSWDLPKIDQSTTDNVLHLLRAKINLLTFATQETLKLAACMGHQFDLKTLLIINGQSVNQTAEQLGQAINANLIYPLEETYKTQGLVGLVDPLNTATLDNLNYKFAHDRIQQATYELIKEQDRASIHLKIGRLLIKNNPLEEHEERLFTVLKHFNQSIPLIEEIEERHLLAKYNYWASKKAKAASAYHAANDYLEAALEFLKPNNWKKNYNLSFQIHKEFAVCKYLIGDFNTADQYFSELLTNSRSELDNLEIYRLKIEMLSTLGKHPEALEIGLTALRQFGIKIPKNPNTLHLLSAIYHIKFQLRYTEIEKLNLLPMVDLQQKAIVDLITQLFNSAFITNQKLFVLLTCKTMMLSLKHGYTASTSMSIPVYAFVLMHSLYHYEEALAFVALYNRLKQEYGMSNFEGKNLFVLSTFIDPYRTSLNDCNVLVQEAFRYCCDVGDLVYGNYSQLLLVIHAWSAGKNIGDVKKNVQSVLSFMTRVKISDFNNVAKFWEYAVQCIENPSTVNPEKLKHFEEIIIQGKSKTELSFYYSTATRLHFFLGNYLDALHTGELHELNSDYDKGLVSHLDGKFFFALAVFYSYPQLSQAERKHYSKKLKQINQLIQQYARWCPENFKAYALMLDCELARLEHKSESILPLYEQIIDVAMSSDLQLMAAIANQRAGELCLDLNLERVSKFYLRNAIRYFKEWGVISKVKLLDQSPANLNCPVKPQENLGNPWENAGNLDMLTLLNSTQQLSSEIRLDKLLQKFLLVIMQITGAERVFLFNRVNSHWVLQAEGDAVDSHLHLNNLPTHDTPENYPLSLLNHVHSMAEPLIISNPQHHGLTMHDTYFQNKQLKSVLIFPMFYQGQFAKMIYAEQPQKEEAFSMSHFSSLQMLINQVMPSFDNAQRFYEVTHDFLTGLPNRNLLHEIFQYTVKQIARSHGEIALLYVELDTLKEINDHYGTSIGDRVLQHVTNIIVTNLRAADFVTRIGGNEFVIMLTNTTSQTQLSVILDRLFNLFSRVVEIDEHLIHISVSIGISLFPHDGNEIQKLLQYADIAHQQAQEKGKNQYHYYSK